jgi:hypothetical protein
MRSIFSGESVEYEVLERAHEVEDEAKKVKKANRKTSEQIEAEEAIEEESPAPGYPNDTVIPTVVRY